LFARGGGVTVGSGPRFEKVDFSFFLSLRVRRTLPNSCLPFYSSGFVDPALASITDILFLKCEPVAMGSTTADGESTNATKKDDVKLTKGATIDDPEVTDGDVAAKQSAKPKRNCLGLFRGAAISVLSKVRY